jgi:TolB-like protein/tetratricopeptide (TPR) repeat protein
MTAPDRLESWKEIAAYLRRSVRTVRRWEAQEGLPVHRLMHQSQASVYALRSEIDEWRQRRNLGPAETAPTPTTRPAAVDPAQPSIAVLPFGYLGPDPQQEYIADGFTEEVISALSKIRSLRIISRTSSMALKGTSRDARTIGADLQVRFLLEGTVRSDGARIRISSRLIDPEADDRLWADSYEGSVEEIFSIEERIARRIASALKLHLTPDEDRLLADRSGDNVVAWQCALQARQEALRWRRDAIDRAVHLLERGIEVVGDHADLHATLSWVHLQYREAGVDLGPEPLARAERHAARLFELEPASPVGRLLLAGIHYARGRFQEAARELAPAVASGQALPDMLGLLANLYLLSGQVDAARPLIEQALAVDPLTPLIRCLPGYADAMEGRFDRAVGPYREMFEMDPGNPMGRLFYTWILAVNGDAEGVQEVVAGFPEELAASPPAQVASLFAAGMAGRSINDIAPISPWTEALAGSADLFPRFLAQAYALLGDEERALHWIAVAVDHGFINYPFLARHDPFLRRLADHPTYVELLKRVKRRWEDFEP